MLSGRIIDQYSRYFVIESSGERNRPSGVKTDSCAFPFAWSGNSKRSITSFYSRNEVNLMGYTQIRYLG